MKYTTLQNWTLTLATLTGISCSSTKERPALVDPLKGQKIIKTITVRKTIVVKKGKTLGDSKAKGLTHYKAHKSMGDGGQDERQKEIIIFEGGSRAYNIAWTGAKGVRVRKGGEVRLYNVHANPKNKKQPFERAMRVDKDAKVRIARGTFRRFDDKAINTFGGTYVKLFDVYVNGGERFYSSFWLRHGPTNSKVGKKTKTSGNRIEGRNVHMENTKTGFKLNQRADGGSVKGFLHWNVEAPVKYSEWGKEGSLKVSE